MDHRFAFSSSVNGFANACELDCDGVGWSVDMPGGGWKDVGMAIPGGIIIPGGGPEDAGMVLEEDAGIIPGGAAMTIPGGAIPGGAIPGGAIPGGAMG